MLVSYIFLTNSKKKMSFDTIEYSKLNKVKISLCRRNYGAISAILVNEYHLDITLFLNDGNSYQLESQSWNDFLKAVEIMKDAMPEAEILELQGCSLDSVLYYVNQDIPVLAMLQDGSAVLVIGFNEQNTVVMNPEKGTVYKVGMKDSTEWFEQNGNSFITYVRKENG